jgi:hypothetical protein
MFGEDNWSRHLDALAIGLFGLSACFHRRGRRSARPTALTLQSAQTSSGCLKDRPGIWICSPV